MRNTIKPSNSNLNPLTIGILTLTAATLLLFSTACGGGAGTELAGDSIQNERMVSAGVPGNLLPPPSSLLSRLGDSPKAACPGDGFETQLPHHRCSPSNSGTLFSPGRSSGKGNGGKNGQYAYALYHVRSPHEVCNGEDDDCNGRDLRLNFNPLFEGGGTSGEMPLYVAVADFESNTWTTRAQDYNSSRSNRTLSRLDDDDDGDSIPTEEWLVAVIVGPAPGGGGGGGGSILVESLSVSSGWEATLLDEGLRSSSIPEGSSEMDACRAPDGSHHLAYFTGKDGLRHIRCADGTCRSSAIPDSSGSGPNVGMCVSPKGSPYVCSTDSARGSGAIKWFNRTRWETSFFSTGDKPTEAFDPRWSSDVAITADGQEHVVRFNPLATEMTHFSRKPGGDWTEEVIVKDVEVCGRPELLVSEWDELVCVYRTGGSDGKVHVARIRPIDEKREVTFPAPCPVEADGTEYGSLSADLDRDGRLDIVCNTSTGDVAIHVSLRDWSTEMVALSASREPSSCVSVLSYAGSMHAFVYSESTGEVRYIRKRPGRITHSSRVVARYAPAVSGVEGHVTVLKIFFDPDSDNDEFGDVSCYIMESSSSGANPDVRHWTLEVRVNRIDMA